jgi:hypothetical protein
MATVTASCFFAAVVVASSTAARHKGMPGLAVGAAAKRLVVEVHS